MSLIVLAASFFIGLAVGLPAAITLGLSSFAYILHSGLPLAVIPQKFYAGVDVFVLLSIPGFILAGNLMNQGGITARIVTFANALVGWVRGGLGVSNVAASMLFGGISGTAAGDAAAIGGVMIPAMEKSGYPPPFSAAVTAASSTLGPIIPPSVPMIIVGSLSGISVGRMFIAGIIPGVLLGLGMMLTAFLLALRNDFPRQTWGGIEHLWSAFLGAIWSLAMTAFIIGGLLSGLMTPTETAIAASIYAFVVGAFVYGELRLRAALRILIDSGISASAILLLVGFANVFAWILVTEHVPRAISDSILSVTDNKFLVLLLINVILLFVGMFMETIAALIIMFVPLQVLAQGVGVDPIHFAVLAVMNLMIGLTTPPIGVCLFICANIARVPLGAAIRAILPFLLCNLVILFVVTYVPATATWLPGLLFD